MSSIIIADLSPAGSEILVSDESYLDTLGEVEMNIVGGLIYSPELEKALSLIPTKLSLCVELG
jgi:hypothetical protein